MFTVPFVAGRTVDAAMDALVARGYIVAGPILERSDSLAAGLVIRTVPPEDTELGVGEDVFLIVSAGPPPPPVPDVVGLTAQPAVAILRGSGYRVKLMFAPSSEENIGWVVRQDPAGGTGLAPPGPVTIFVGKPERYLGMILTGPRPFRNLVTRRPNARVGGTGRDSAK